jgi:Zn-dependent protease with chaperone function
MVGSSFVESPAPRAGTLRGNHAGTGALGAGGRVGSRRPAALAASRTFAASFALGLLGLGWAAFALARGLSTWRVAPAEPSHEMVLLGQRLSYPAANASAVLVLALAVLGLLVLTAAVQRLVRELLAERRARRVLLAAGARGPSGAWMTAGAQPHAFCAGLLRPRVFLSHGAVELLDARELDAVVAHERHHANSRDPLRLACGRVLADALFFLPAVRAMVERQQALAELGADEAAVLDGDGDGSALASAMLSFSAGEGVGIDPERVDHLLGARVRLGLPLALCAGVLTVLSGLVAAAVLAGQAAAGSLTLSLPFLSAQPCVVVLASVPLCVLALGALYCRRRSQHTT